MINFIEIIRNFSIKQKLILLSMITSTIAIIITCAGFIAFDILEEKNDMIGEMSLVGNLLSEEIATAVAYDQVEVVEESLESLNARNSIIQACVYDSDGNEFAKFIRSDFNEDCSTFESMEPGYKFFINKYLITKTLIKFDDNTKGSIYIIASLARIDNKVKKSITYALILFILIIVISYLIALLLQHNISYPISHLAKVSNIVRQGNYKVRAKHFYNDEIGDLTNAFNSMLNKIQESKETLEDKVKQRTSDLEKAIKAKSEFMSNISHEIRTPIHGITNYADFLVQDWQLLTKEQKYNFISKLYTNSRRLLSLINNLLDLSKLDANKMDFHFEQHNFTEIIYSVIQESEPLYINKKKDLSIVFNNQEPFIVELDKERIQQVIRNLLSNSIKFTKEGIIEITIEKINSIINKKRNHEGLKFTIKDNGIGIPKNELKYIFDKFNQSALTKTGAGGTGLGLAICREIIKAHKGKIWAENNLIQGSSFYFIIPIKQK